MNKLLLAFGLVAIIAPAAMSQDKSSAKKKSPNEETVISKNDSPGIASGTQISGQLQTTLDVNKTAVGDAVILKATKDIKEGKNVIVKKGSQIVGKVTEVQRRTKDQAQSKLSVVFDSVRNGNLVTPVSATIVSVIDVQSTVSTNDDTTGMSGDAGMSGRTTNGSTTRGTGGGLLGGVTNTVGGVVNSTTNTVGGVTNGAATAVSGTTNAVGGSLRGIRISTSTDVSANGTSTISSDGKTLRLEKGTTFNLVVSPVAGKSQ